MNVVTRATDFFGTHGLCGTTGVVACSGGPDSTLLAFIGHRLVHEGVLAGVRLAHVNHCLRGEASELDEAFVRALGARFGMIVEVDRRDTADAARVESENLENQARAERYTWFEAVARRNGARWIATGHTADDQAETVLHHILRGSGLAGWAGIAPRRRFAEDLALVRPLLDVRRSEVLACLAEWGEAYRVDASNEDRRFTRNRLRHDVLPALASEFNPRLAETLCRAAAQSREALDFLRRHAEDLLRKAECPRAGNTVVLRADVIADAEIVAGREALRLVWTREGWPAGSMTFEDWNLLVQLMRGGDSSHDFPGPVHARRVRKVLQLTYEAAKVHGKQLREPEAPGRPNAASCQTFDEPP